MAGKVEYFSLVPHAYSIPLRAEEENGDGNKPIVDRIVIDPGRNRIPAEKWKRIDTTDDRIKARFDRGHIADEEPSELVKRTTLDGRPPPKLVSQLSDKAKEIPEFDESNPQADENRVFE